MPAIARDVDRCLVAAHPGNVGNREHREYQRLGEPDYIALKWEQFADAVWADPLDFLDRLASRFLCARPCGTNRRRRIGTRATVADLVQSHLIHPLPFLALIVLLIPAIRGAARNRMVRHRNLRALPLPYVVASYYDRYAMPLLGVKVLLLIWAIQRLMEMLNRPRNTDQWQALSLCFLADICMGGVRAPGGPAGVTSVARVNADDLTVLCADVDSAIFDGSL